MSSADGLRLDIRPEDDVVLGVEVEGHRRLHPVHRHDRVRPRQVVLEGAVQRNHAEVATLGEHQDVFGAVAARPVGVKEAEWWREGGSTRGKWKFSICFSFLLHFPKDKHGCVHFASSFFTFGLPSFKNIW